MMSFYLNFTCLKALSSNTVHSEILEIRNSTYKLGGRIQPITAINFRNEHTLEFRISTGIHTVCGSFAVGTCSSFKPQQSFLTAVALGLDLRALSALVTRVWRLEYFISLHTADCFPPPGHTWPRLDQSVLLSGHF